MITLLIFGLMKKILFKTSQYFPKPYRSFEGNVKLELNLCSYETKAELKNVIGVDTSKLTAKSDLAILKEEVDKINVEKLKAVAVPVDSSNLGNVVRNEIVSKNLYKKIVTKVNSIDTGGFFLKK